VRGKKVLVASRHSIVRHGLQLMLTAATPLTVIGDASPLRQLPSAVQTHEPDVVVLDLEPGCVGLEEALSLCATSTSRPRILLLTADLEGDRGVRPGLQVADGVASIHGDATDLVQMVIRLVQDASLQPLPAERPKVDALESAGRSKGGSNITPREWQIMELISEGACNKRIARSLDISVTTVRTHRQKLMSKLGLRNAVEIARFTSGAAKERSQTDIQLVNQARSTSIHLIESQISR
jgi:DNA-binding NarL/FixJ family response regulator